MIRSRRAFTKGAIAAGLVCRGYGAINSIFNGVRLGIGSYSFRGFTVDELISQMVAIPLGELELESWFVEPRSLAVAASGRGPISPDQRDGLRKWRLNTPLDEFRALRKKFEDAGVHVYAYNIPVDSQFTDEELDRIFQMAQALGVAVLNVVTTLPTAPRLAAPAAQYKMRVGFHPSGGQQTSDSIGNGESYRKVIALSANFGINPDLGQSPGWGADPIAFLREMHHRVTTLHTHDRKLQAPGSGSAFVPFGEGQMPIREILQLIRKEKYSFVPMVERIYPLDPPGGPENVKELRRAVQYCKDALA